MPCDISSGLAAACRCPTHVACTQPVSSQFSGSFTYFCPVFYRPLNEFACPSDSSLGVSFNAVSGLFLPRLSIFALFLPISETNRPFSTCFRPICTSLVTYFWPVSSSNSTAFSVRLSNPVSCLFPIQFQSYLPHVMLFTRCYL